MAASDSSSSTASFSSSASSPSVSGSTSRATPIPGFRPLPDDADPLGQLDACHDRMQRQLKTLQRLLERQADAGRASVDDEVRAAAAAVRKYFDEAAPRHHRDEEKDLFPAVIEAMAGSDAVCIKGIVQRLSAEHGQLEQAWQALRPTLVALAEPAEVASEDSCEGSDESGGSPWLLDAGQVDRFIAVHRSHLAIEDDELMPMARRLLSDDQIAQIGRAMRSRRDR